MSASRIFRYDLHNDVLGHTLILQKEHLCGGCYTSDWEPTQQIDYDQTRGMQAESCNFMTGTQGWVKYQIIRDSDQAMRGLVYLYWTNPYFGITFGRQALATRRWTANCDEHEPGAGSGFASDEDPPFGFHLSIENTLYNGSPTAVDELGDLYRVPLAPVFAFGTGRIWERMQVIMKLSSDERPSVLPSRGQRTLSLETQPRRSILEGEWSNDHVAVTIRNVFAGQYEVALADSTPSRPFNVTAVCSFGTSGLAKVFAADETLESLVATKKVGTSYAEIAKAHVALSGLTAVLRTAGALDSNGVSWLGMSKSGLVTAAKLKQQAQEIGVTNLAVLDVLADAAAAHAEQSDYTLWPTRCVALQLYKESEDGRLAGYKLLYQRVLGDGTVLCSEFLTYRSFVR